MKDIISKKQLREFGLLIGFAFPILIGWLIPAFAGHSFRAWSLWIGISGIIFGLISPNLLRYPYKAWMALGNVLGWLNSYLIFGVIFIAVVQPISYFMRLAGYDPLRKARKGKTTYREIRHIPNTDLTRIF